MKKLFDAVFVTVIVIPVMFLLLTVSGVLRIMMRFGIGFTAQRKVSELAQSIAMIRLREVLVYKYPVPAKFVEEGHIRFSAIRTANVKNVPLDPATQHAMLYMARVNFIDRLLLPSDINIKQLKKALAGRRFHAEEVFVFKPGEPIKFSNTIKLNPATKKEAP